MDIPQRLLHMRTALALLIFSIACFTACKSKNEITTVDPAFSKYIEAYTSGVISKKNTIRIQLASESSVTHTLNENLKENYFHFSPDVKGSAYWVDARTLEFKPAEDLKPGQLYNVSFDLGKVMNVPDQYKDFKFDVQVLRPSFQVTENGLRAISKEMMTLSGVLTTADVEKSDVVEKLLSAKMNDQQMAISWQHNESAKTHQFFINNIKRGTSGNTLELNWKGDALGVADVTGNEQVAVPAIGDFKVLDVRAMQENESYVLVQFSDPISIGQTLDGLITVSNTENTSYTIAGSEVKVYNTEGFDGTYTVNVNTGIENEWGDKLEKTYTANIFFENRLPSVKIQGNGSILPVSTGRLVLPFEATNLKAVDVSIIKIYANNVARFLQDNNNMNGEYNLRKVGSPLVEATVQLNSDQSLDLHKKNKFSLDLDKYIKAEPGAMYRVFIGFRPEYSLYSCAEKKTTTADGDENDDEEDYYYNDYYDDDNRSDVDGDDAFWRRYDDYYPYGYSWRQRDNPCSRSYYNKERFASRNILATNIGLTAKRGNNNALFVAANDILSTEPLSGTELQVLDYQQQIIGSAKTDGDGLAIIQLKKKPYLLIAKNGDQRSYLKLDDGTSLPISRFDVGGDELKNGIKAFIFGERGVWRPGDSLYLSCIVDDKGNPLPAGHPVEMQLISPKGQLYKKIVQPNAADGFNVFRTATDADALTGNWICRIKIGGATFDKKIKIETVMPNRLKINLDFGNAEALGKHATINGKLTAKWLFGATAQNLKARVDAQLYKKKTSFKGFNDYVFDDPTSSFTSQSKTIFDGSLDENGEATINPDFEPGDDAPGQLLANLMIKVFEPGGNFSVDNISMPFNPYSSYVGVHIPEGDKTWGFLQSGKTHVFDVADVDVNGKPVNGSSKIIVELYKIQWRWWWDESGDDLSNFTQDQYNKLIKKDTLYVNNGKGNYRVHFDEDDWGRYLVLMKDTRSGHTTGSTFFIDDYGWQSRSGTTDPSAAAMLSFTADKEKYNVGETVTLTIPGVKNGRALISLESGSKVVKTFWIKTEQGNTKFSFKAESNMSPNVYANVSLLQPHAQTVNDLPIRMYGVIPIMIEDKNTVLKPVIKMPDEIKPETKNAITVSEASGKKMTYVIALVDEGLLDLTRYKTPDPHAAFYAREALGVKSWDVYDDVIGAWGAELQRILTIGGDGEAELASKTRRANRFKPVVQFMGPFTSKGGSNTHSFALPPYMGSVKAMVIAAGDNAYGMAEKSVVVKKPLMLLATMPRVLGPDESLKIPVTVFATNNSVKKVNLSIEANPFIEAAGNQQVSFSQTGEQVVYFNAHVKPNTGIGKVKIKATSGNEQDVAEVEIDIRNPNPLLTQVTEATLQAGQSWNSSVAMIGDASTSKATLEVSSIPAINLEKRLTYLIQYPHGCIEQTTSSVFPQLVLNQLTNLDQQQKTTIDVNVRSGINKLINFQQSDGGFSYWPGGDRSDEWGTNYAGHFLLEASAKGYAVPSSMLQTWKVYEHNKAVAWNTTQAPYYGSDLNQAYRLYLLALAKAPELGAMNLLKEYKFLSAEAKWRLAAAYQLVGQSKIALQLITGLTYNFPQRTNPGFTYGSDLRDEAMVLETLTLMGRKSEADLLVKSIAAKLAQDYWYSTQTTAYSLIAIAEYCGANNNGKKIIITGTAGSQKADINTGTSVSQRNIAWQGNKAAVQIKNNGNNVLYVRIINEGKPIHADTLPVENNPQVLLVNTSFLDNTGKIIEPNNLKQGTDFIAKVTVKNPGYKSTYTNLALTQIFPSGWEILNTRLYNSEGAFTSSPSDYMDIRDDRVYHYFDLQAGESKTFYVQLNAAYPGKFYWPGTYAEAMYDHTISGGTGGKWVQVTE